MMENVIPEFVLGERIQGAGVSVDGPVAAEFLWAKHEHAFVAQFEILDDGEGGVGFAQAYAVRQNAAVVGENLVDGGLGAVLLESEEFAPDVRVGKRHATEVVVDVAGAIEEIAEKVEERKVIDELRGLVRIKFAQVEKHFLFDVLHQIGVVPDFGEPLFQILAVAGAIDDQVQLDVVVAVAQAEAAHGEVGTAENGLL